MARHKITSSGINAAGNEVAIRYECTDPNCNCEGGWTEGNTEEVEQWVEEDDQAECQNCGHIDRPGLLWNEKQNYYDQCCRVCRSTDLGEV